MIIVTNITTGKCRTYETSDIVHALKMGYYHLNPKIKYNKSDDDMLNTVMVKTDYYYTLFNCFAIDTNKYLLTK